MAVTLNDYNPNQHVRPSFHQNHTRYNHDIHDLYDFENPDLLEEAGENVLDHSKFKEDTIINNRRTKSVKQLLSEISIDNTNTLIGLNNPTEDEALALQDEQQYQQRLMILSEKCEQVYHQLEQIHDHIQQKREECHDLLSQEVRLQF